MPEWVTLIVTAVIGVGTGSGVALLLKVPSDTRKNDADSAAVLSEASLNLVREVRQQLADARKEVEELRRELREARAENDLYRKLHGPLNA